MYADNLSLFFNFLALRLCLCLCRPVLHVSTTQRRKHKQKRMEIVPFSCAGDYVCVVASSCKPERGKHKHKRKHEALMLASHRFTRRFLVLMLLFMLMLIRWLMLASNV